MITESKEVDKIEIASAFSILRFALRPLFPRIGRKWRGPNTGILFARVTTSPMKTPGLWCWLTSCTPLS